MPRLVAVLDPGAQCIEAVRNLGYEDHVGRGRYTGEQCDPAGVPTHELHYHDTAVSLCGGVEPADSVGGCGYGGVEAKGHLGRSQIVVDGLGDSHDREPLVGQHRRDSERAVPSDGDQSVNPSTAELSDDLVGPVYELHRSVGSLHGPLQGISTAGGAQDGAPQVRDAADGLTRQGHHSVVLEEALISVPDPEHVPAQI